VDIPSDVLPLAVVVESYGVSDLQLDNSST